MRRSPNARRPAWVHVTFEKIEEWRTARGVPKRRMAEEVLGVTNSTYHNWARGSAVPTSGTQRRIASLIGPALEAVPARETHSRSEEVSTLVCAYLRSCGGKVQPAELVRLVGDLKGVVSRG